MSEQEFAFFNELIEENRELKMKFGGQQGIINSLKKENEQLRKELDGFHPVMFQDMRKGTVVLYLKKVE